MKPIVYVAHPANADPEETFAIIFKGPDDGPVVEGAEEFFAADARRIARLLAAMSTGYWRWAFTNAWLEAVGEVDDYFDRANDEDATVEAFVGEPIKRLN